MSASQRLRELGERLPRVAAPAGAYVPAVRSGALVFTAGQLPIVDGQLVTTGKVGAEVEVDHAVELARRCALNALAAIDTLVGLDSVTRVVKVTGFVASAPGFGQQPAVLDGASALFGTVFGADGAHARSAVGVAELPKNAPVEVEVVVEVSTADAATAVTPGVSP
ncbi:MAG: RidA family protein [Pseudonocardia sp.]|nr:RidA family protein [Pseudonocardia sp.]